MIPIRAYSALLPIAITLRLSADCMLAQEEPADLIQARALYQRDVDFATRPIRDKYVAKLETLKRTLGGRGEAKAAATVQDEIDRTREITTGQIAIARFAGDWKVAYSVGTVRDYVITREGQVTADEHDGKPPKTAKLIVKGNDVLLDLDEAGVPGSKSKDKPKSVYKKNFSGYPPRLRYDLRSFGAVPYRNVVQYSIK